MPEVIDVGEADIVTVGVESVKTTTPKVVKVFPATVPTFPVASADLTVKAYEVFGTNPVIVIKCEVVSSEGKFIIQPTDGHCCVNSICPVDGSFVSQDIVTESEVIFVFVTLDITGAVVSVLVFPESVFVPPEETTIITTEDVTETPAEFTQVNAYLISILGVTDSDPDVDLEPTHPSEAVQETAFELDQLKTAELPEFTDVCEVERFTTGSGTVVVFVDVVNVLLAFAPTLSAISAERTVKL